MALLTKGCDFYSVLSIMISLILTEINFPSKTNVLLSPATNKSTIL